MQSTMFQGLADKLINGVLSTPDAEHFMGRTCELLIEGGLPLWRVGVFVRTLHPDMFVRSFVWRHGAGVSTYAAPFGIDESDDFRSSPLSILYSTRQEVRGRMVDANVATNSPFLMEMEAENVTDYIAIPLHFTDGEIRASSWTTRQPGGFTDAQIEGLRAFIPSLARIIEIVRLRRAAAGLLSVYVGHARGRTHPSRANPPRPHRDHACCDLTVRSARLRRVVGPAVAGGGWSIFSTDISIVRCPRFLNTAARF